MFFFKFYFIILLFFLVACKKKQGYGSMPDEQLNTLNNLTEKSISLSERADAKIIKQIGDIIVLDTNNLNLKTIELSLPNDYDEYMTFKETDNYYIMTNIFISSTVPNILKFNKDGEFVSSFGRKGEGPDEILQIGTIDEKDHISYVFGKGKIQRFNEENILISSKFIAAWAHDVYLTKNAYILETSMSEVFSFPAQIFNIVSDTLLFAINDTESDIFNFNSAVTNVFSNDSIILYAKGSGTSFHIFDLKTRKQIASYQLVSKHFRENTTPLQDNPNKQIYAEFFSNLFLMNNIHFDKGLIWLIFKDNQNKNLFLCRVENLEFQIYDIRNISYQIDFFKSKINFRRNGKDGKVRISYINLSELK